MVNKDTIIPCEHSEELIGVCKGPSCLIISTEMDHNKFYYNQDFLKPLWLFLKKYKIISKEAFQSSKSSSKSIDGSSKSK